jgi:hypothetical protein
MARIISNIGSFFLIIQVCLGCVNSKDQHENISRSLAAEDLCSKEKKSVVWEDQIETLNKISRLFYKKCYREVISIAQKALEKYRYKTFSVVDESLEFFIPEGTLSDYVLESYERGYLSFLITISYIHLEDPQGFRAALNRFYHEEVAFLYNHGQDPVNTLLQAVLWDSYPSEGFSSRPFWLQLSRNNDTLPPLKKFAVQRIIEIDQKKAPKKWNITAIGQFPKLDWNINFIDSKAGYFEVKTLGSFPKACFDKDTIMIPTTSWFKKIAMRHSRSYHPIVNAKSWIRLPVGIVYGISAIAAGASFMVGGCTLDALLDTRGSGGVFCRVAVEGGIAIMKKSDDVVENALRPDMRHWETIPLAFIIEKSAEKSDHQIDKNTENHSDEKSGIISGDTPATSKDQCLKPKKELIRFKMLTSSVS